MADIYDVIGQKIREFRTAFEGTGISQEALAREMKTTANTISRWETAVYKPSISDLEKLAAIFGIPITAFFPQPNTTSRTASLLSAVQGLTDADFEEVIRYALFRRATGSVRKR